MYWQRPYSTLHICNDFLYQQLCRYYRKISSFAQNTLFISRQSLSSKIDNSFTLSVFRWCAYNPVAGYVVSELQTSFFDALSLWLQLYSCVRIPIRIGPNKLFYVKEYKTLAGTWHVMTINFWISTYIWRTNYIGATGKKWTV